MLDKQISFGVHTADDSCPFSKPKTIAWTSKSSIKVILNKLKSITNRKLAAFRDQELPLLNPVFPNLDLTKSSKMKNKDNKPLHLTEFSKNELESSKTNIDESFKEPNNEYTNLCEHMNGNIYHLKAKTQVGWNNDPKYYINNPPE